MKHEAQSSQRNSDKSALLYREATFEVRLTFHAVK